MRDIWDSRAPREWGFAALVFVVFGSAVAMLVSLMALDPQGDQPGLWLKVAALFLGPPILLGVVSLVLFGWGRIKKACGVAGAAFGLTWLAFMATMALPAILHGPRHLLLGTERGTIEQVAGRTAAFVELTPAIVDVSRIGTGVTSTSDKDGRTTTKSRSVAPIVSALGEQDASATAAEEVHFFLCDDADDIRDEAGRGGGTVAGRVELATGLAVTAIRELGTSVRVGPAPRCVTPTLGDATTTGRLWVLVFVLDVLVFGGAAAFFLLRIAMPKRKP